ncbi:hypothetical protein ARMSODRAFT_324506 [Armillaria solidipes]|uniref:Uncharacterized protein n=1 Tax=Armillaria solidipes TaxID=1076256 RepID=A0A2H3BJP5_9AGAR|nr:hypothetical protein ARMSODRAFT_324506 [Armillaria solidipes]
MVHGPHHLPIALKRYAKGLHLLNKRRRESKNIDPDWRITVLAHLGRLLNLIGQHILPKLSSVHVASAFNN